MYVCNWANHLIFLISVNMNNDGYKESVKEISRDKYSSLVYSVFVSTPASLLTYNGLQFSQDKVHFYEYCQPSNNNTHCVFILPVCASSYVHLSSCVYRAHFLHISPSHWPLLPFHFLFCRVTEPCKAELDGDVAFRTEHSRVFHSLWCPPVGLLDPLGPEYCGG